MRPKQMRPPARQRYDMNTAVSYHGHRRLGLSPNHRMGHQDGSVRVARWGVNPRSAPREVPGRTVLTELSPPSAGGGDGAGGIGSSAGARLGTVTTIVPASVRRPLVRDLDATAARLRLEAALDGVAAAFRGMTAQPDEYNCDCHWGSAEELAQLKVPDVELDADLLRRTWSAPDWDDHASVLRRILPQLTTALVGGLVDDYNLPEVGRSLARGRWQQWPAEQAAAVQEFLHAWWTRTLTDPHAAVPSHDVLPLIAEASATLGPWLDTWEALTNPVADQRLAETVARWAYHLLGDKLPWNAWDNEEDMRTELIAWLVRHATARLRVHGVSEELLHQLWLLGLAGPSRPEDPHRPNRRY
jgi:hypothetical protein